MFLTERLAWKAQTGHTFLEASGALIDSIPRADADCPRLLAHPAAGNGCAGPAFAGGAVGSECNLIVVDTCDVLDDAFPVSGPRIDPEGEVHSGFHAIAVTSSLPS
jgi:hypothetical protein